MVNVVGGKCVTITLAAGSIYEVALSQGKKVSVVNATTAPLYVSETEDFSVTDGVGRYVSIPSGGAVNDFELEKSCNLYLKANGSGTATVAIGR